MSFDIKSWETLTQAHGFGKYANKERTEEKNHELSLTKNEEEMKKLLLENENQESKNSSGQLFSTSNEDE